MPAMPVETCSAERPSGPLPQLTRFVLPTFHALTKCPAIDGQSRTSAHGETTRLLPVVRSGMRRAWTREVEITWALSAGSSRLNQNSELLHVPAGHVPVPSDKHL